MKKISLFILLLSALIGSAQPKLVDGVVAVVGKNIVLKSDVDQQFENMKRQGLDNFKSTKCEVFEEILFEKLLLHQSEIDSIVVSDEEVELSIDRRIDVYVQQIGSRQKLEQYYKKTVLEIKEEMESFIRDQMIAQRMLQEVTADVEITPTEVRTFYNGIPEDSLPLVNTQLEYAQILNYPEPGQLAMDEAIKRLVDIKQRVLDGSSFSTMAVLYSEDPGSARNGGKYEGIKRGQFVKEFEAIAFNLKEGEISDPFKTEYGYHIVQLLKRRGEELDLRHVLIKPKITTENLEESKKFLDSLRRLILEGEYTFEQMAERNSDDEFSRLNGGLVLNPSTGDSKWETGQLDKAIFYSLEGMDPGDISDPQFFRSPDDKEGYRLMRMVDKTEPHRANLKTDYQLIQQIALQQKKNDQLDTWINEKLKTTYVRVNNDYLNCTFKNAWIKQSQYVE